MSGLVLMGLVYALIIYISIVKKKRRALVISLAILVAYIAYVKHTCGANAEDVKVMKPMAEKISAYIVKHGIPDSLEEIPDLPYRLEGCEKVQENLERCTFYKHKHYEVQIYILGGIDIEVYSKTTQTGLRYELQKKEDDIQWILSKKDIAFSSKIDGICNPMRQ